MLKQVLKTLLFCGTLILGAEVATAQMLDSSQGGNPPNAMDYLRALNQQENPEGSKANAKTATNVEAETSKDPKADPKTGSAEEAAKKTQTLRDLKAKVVDGNLKMNPPEMAKTQDGSKRGDAGFVKVLKKDEKADPKEDKKFIFLYYSNFKMTRSYAGGLGCRVKFAVMTNFDQRLINLSVKLVWPQMTTSVSFDNVSPNIENYFDYALFGDGCYSMDKIPNIVVNRCRTKGMTQAQCASKIRWLSKSK